MQIDMHFYGVYAMARAAGLKPEHAHTVAYASQFVDDATRTDTEDHEDGGKMRAIATAHSGGQVMKNLVVDILEQRRVWVPFHFLPGGEGADLSEKLLCRLDSPLAQEMMRNHIAHAVQSDYPLQLMGIACHVYADTFSHWGFSGVCSRRNMVKGNSFEFENVTDKGILAYITNKYTSFLAKYTPSFLIDNWRKIASGVGEKASGALGHGAVGTYPDRPYLHWKFTYEQPDKVSDRDNPTNFLKACARLHEWLSEFARQYYQGETVAAVRFQDIESEVKAIIDKQARKEDRIAAWQEAVSNGKLFTPGSERHHYDAKDWERMKEGFSRLSNSAEILKQPIYAYHQAALYHRHYVLKVLLPRHGMAIY